MATRDSKFHEENIKPYGENYTTMTPGPFAKFLRKCLIWQFLRFIAINIKMITVVQKSH